MVVGRPGRTSTSASGAAADMPMVAVSLGRASRAERIALVLVLGFQEGNFLTGPVGGSGAKASRNAGRNRP